MIKNYCPICGPKAYHKVLYEQNFAEIELKEKIFSARRLPDRLHYRIAKCLSCGVIYSDPLISYKQIENFYKKSRFFYKELVRDLADTYGFYLKELEKRGVNKGRLLDIGCGNGFFLKEALEQGYKQVFGVEPSRETVKQASKDIRKRIINNFFRKNLFPKNYFDVICMFQVFDHILEPNEFLKNCRYYLKNGGFILAINHNGKFLGAKVFGEKFPIYDVAHPFIYDTNTMRKIFEKNNLEVIKSSPCWNIYKVSYLIKMFPVSQKLKSYLNKTLHLLNLENRRIKIAIGNLMLIAKKH